MARRKQASQAGFGKLLEAWIPPDQAGDSIGCIATTFTFNAAFFEEECLAGFLGLESEPNEDGPAYLIEREEKLAKLSCAAVLVNAHHCRGRRNLRWDLLTARLPGGIQHAKVSLLVWTNHVRVIIGSANLTEDGYRRNRGLRPLALNFANGVETGGGFLRGATAQEEALCRSSALYATLVDDPLYDYHRADRHLESSSWTILSPNVPVFRTDDGMELEKPWLLSLVTCAAPYVPGVGQPLSGDLLQERIHRVLAIARAYRYRTLVLGAWGCGAFGNNVLRTASDFRTAIEGEFSGAFADIVFAIADWSPERRTLGPFRDVFSAELAE